MLNQFWKGKTSKPTSDQLIRAVLGTEMSKLVDFQTIHFPAGNIREGYMMVECFFDTLSLRRIALLMLVNPRLM
jgi:hypothetical protein